MASCPGRMRNWWSRNYKVTRFAPLSLERGNPGPYTSGVRSATDLTPCLFPRRVSSDLFDERPGRNGRAHLRRPIHHHAPVAGRSSGQSLRLQSSFTPTTAAGRRPGHDHRHPRRQPATPDETNHETTRTFKPRQRAAHQMIFIGLLAMTVASYYRNLIPNFRAPTRARPGTRPSTGPESAGGLRASPSSTTGPQRTPTRMPYPLISNNWSMTDSADATTASAHSAPPACPSSGGTAMCVARKSPPTFTPGKASATEPTHNPWFRILCDRAGRSPRPKYVSADKREIHLRRMKLAAKTKHRRGRSARHATIEIIARPRYRLRQSLRL